MPSYATTADVTSRYDIRRLSQFLSDTGTPVCTTAEINAGTCANTIMPANANLLKLIKDASNKVLMSCRVANRYLQSDLDAVYADSDRRESIVRLVCDLVWGYVMIRRGLGMREVFNLAPNYKDALETLEMLKRGDRVFDDSPPDGTDAPNAGAEVDVVSAPGVPGAQVITLGSALPYGPVLWTQDVCRILPGPNRGCGCGGGGGIG